MFTVKTKLQKLNYCTYCKPIRRSTCFSAVYERTCSYLFRQLAIADVLLVLVIDSDHVNGCFIVSACCRFVLSLRSHTMHDVSNWSSATAKKTEPQNRALGWSSVTYRLQRTMVRLSLVLNISVSETRRLIDQKSRFFLCQYHIAFSVGPTSLNFCQNFEDPDSRLEVDDSEDVVILARLLLTNC